MLSQSNNVGSLNMPQCDTVKCLYSDINTHLHVTLAKDSRTASMRDYYLALANTMWERLSLRWLRTKQMLHAADPKVCFPQLALYQRVYYLSMEFFIGRTLGNAILNLGFNEPIQECLNNVSLVSLMQLIIFT